MTKYIALNHDKKLQFKPGAAQPRYALLLQTVQIKINWLLKKPTDLDLHCLALST